MIFAALLDARKAPKTINGAEQFQAGTGRALYLCGSSFPSSQRAVTLAQEQGASVVGMPDEIYYSCDTDVAAVVAWAEDVEAALAARGRAIVNAPQSPKGICLNGRQITAAMAELVRHVLGSNVVDELMIEGGATSQAVMSALQVENLYPSHSLAPGITRMRVDNYPDLHITMKPGSYSWPGEIWQYKN